MGFNNTGLGCRTPCCRREWAKIYMGLKIAEAIKHFILSKPKYSCIYPSDNQKSVEQGKLGMFGFGFMFLHAIGMIFEDAAVYGILSGCYFLCLSSENTRQGSK